MKVAAGGSPCWVPELSTPLFTLKGSLEPHQHATWILRPPWDPGWGSHHTPRFCLCSAHRSSHLGGQGSRQ